MTLLWGAGSPPCWRVMIVLEEKKLQGYKHKLLSFEKGEHKSQEVLEVNPRGQVRYKNTFTQMGCRLEFVLFKLIIRKLKS